MILKANKKWQIIALAIILLPLSGMAQDNGAIAKTDSVFTVNTSKHSPSEATWWSVALPGAGQAYNHKYWKIPVIYTAFGVTGWFIHDNVVKRDDYQKALDLRLDNDPNTVDKYEGVYSDRDLVELVNYHQQYRDLSVIIMVVIYGVQIIDANIDAHLYDFNVSKDLSIHWSPMSFGYDPVTGANLGAKITFDF